MLKGTITGKGQITIPKEIRKKLNLTSGNKIEFFLKNGKIFIVPINNTLESLKGILPPPLKSVSCEEMNEAIRKGREKNLIKNNPTRKSTEYDRN